jgi:DNA-directed RNA polymerase subunit RPC12/RpoP
MAGKLIITPKDPGLMDISESPSLANKSQEANKPAGTVKTEGSRSQEPKIRREPKQAHQFKFLCNTCGRKLEAPENVVGCSITCPNCSTSIEVPKPTPKPQSNKQEKEGTRYVKPKVFNFFCIRCGQELEAKRDLPGTKLNCPQCKSMIVVPEAPDE